MRALWRLATPLAFGAAGALFVTSAGAANGGSCVAPAATSAT